MIRYLSRRGNLDRWRHPNGFSVVDRTLFLFSTRSTVGSLGMLRHPLDEKEVHCRDLQR
ncbi:MAG TPA: hypothetical protein VMK12_01750 [Anaeromyxobacteraceae bacterium]|nr:hypothetical protein [Anaeromyxobacteraceae bacterium]